MQALTTSACICTLQKDPAVALHYSEVYSTH
jgi:hypothetical protein